MADHDALQDIEHLAEMRDKGVISIEEFESKKQELLAQFGSQPPAPLVSSTAISTQPGVAAVLQEQRINNAFLIELVGGILGLLGIGYMYVGRSTEGVVRLIGWWILVGIMWTTIALSMAIVIGFCLVPVGIAVQFGGPIYSANQLKKLLLAEAVVPRTDGA